MTSQSVAGGQFFKEHAAPLPRRLIAELEVSKRLLGAPAMKQPVPNPSF